MRPILDVSAWDLSPGDTIRYLARAVDNHPSQQTRESAEYALWIGGATELGRVAEEELSRAAEAVEELAEEARQAEEEARDLQARAEAEGERNRNRRDQADFAEREEIAQALQRQDEMMQAVDSLQRELAELREALKDAGLADPDMEQTIEDLEQLLDQVAPEDQEDALSEPRISSPGWIPRSYARRWNRWRSTRSGCGSAWRTRWSSSATPPSNRTFAQPKGRRRSWPKSRRSSPVR